MILLSWQDDYEVGVPLIDAEHRYLFGLINEFHDKHASGATRGQVLLVLNRLVAYAEEHFHHEEALMAKNGYPRLAAHQALHERLYSSVFGLNERLSRETGKVDVDTLRFLKTWLLDHILKEDMDIGDFAKRKAVQAEKAARENAQAQARPAAGDAKA
jgi:hemerythrin